MLNSPLWTSVLSVIVFPAACREELPVARWLPWDSDLGNLVSFPHLTHTRFTYHRTWETGLGVEIRVATVNPDFSFSAPSFGHPGSALQYSELSGKGPLAVLAVSSAPAPGS